MDGGQRTEMEKKTCAICHHNLKRGWKCGDCKSRNIHFSCIWKWLSHPGSAPTCPLCRASIPREETVKISLKVGSKTPIPV